MQGALQQMRNLSPICFITPDDRDIIAVGKVVQTALEAGIRWVQFRRKNGARRQLFSDAMYLKNITKQFGAMLVINDYADIAMAVEADGLHVGQDDLPLSEAKKIMGRVIIGVSTHSVAQAVEAMNGGADYIGFGPIFPTATKDAGQPKGAKSIREIKAAVSMPVIAIGGITAHNARDVFAEGCDGIAVSAGIGEGDIKANVAALFSCVQDRCREDGKKNNH
jgi:thiamine-phosphate pyrophosphorylase